MTKLAEFKGRFSSGPQFSNQFEVEITELGSDGTFLCHSAQLPGYQASLAGTIMYGKPEEVPFQISMSPVVVQAYLDSKSTVPKRLEEYRNRMFDPVSYSPAFWVDCQIPSIRIRCLGKDGVPTCTYTLEGCIISEVSAIQLSWSNQSHVAEVSFTINYQQYSVS